MKVPPCLVVCLLMSLPAMAADMIDSTMPDYLTIGGGGFDFDKHAQTRRSVDYRIEYEWGVSLLPKLADSFNSVEPYMQLHPTAGFEGNGNGATYPNAGLDLDVPLFSHNVIATWGEAVGYFSRGDDPRSMGSALEFRSQLELGWQFKGDLRITGFISHISNAHIVSVNPGAEIIGSYVHIPLWVTRRP